MPQETFHKSFYFQASLTIDPEAIAFIISELTGKSATSIRARYALEGGRTVYAKGFEDITQVGLHVYLKSDSLTIHADILSDEVSITFYKSPASDEELYRFLPSDFRISCSRESDVYAFKGLSEYIETYILSLDQSREGMPSLGLNRKLAYEKERDEKHKAAIARIKSQTTTAKSNITQSPKILEPPLVKTSAAVTKPASDAKPAFDSKRLKGSSWPMGRITVVSISVISLGVYLWQGSSGKRQADAADQTLPLSRSQAESAVKQSNLEERADFSLHRKHSPKGNDLRAYETFDLENLGRGIARMTRLGCGTPSGQGPVAEVGTVGPHSHWIKDLQITEDTEDLLHQADHACWVSVYVTYDDGTGHHVITFDPAGNAQPLTDK